MVKPIYLHFSNHVDYANYVSYKFDEEELIYRSARENPPHPKNDFFATIQAEEFFDTGVSVNRDKFCKSEEDVMWRNDITNEDDISFCNYSKRNGFVIFSKYNSLITATTPLSLPNLKIIINRTPNKCNVAHCDVILTPKISNITKQQKRDIRVYLSSLFKEFH